MRGSLMRSSIATALLLCLFVGGAASFPGPVSGKSKVRVIESATRLDFKGDLIEAALTVESSARRSMPAKLHLELIEPTGDRRAVASLNQVIAPGKSTIVCPLEVLYSRLDDDDKKQTLWWRLRYSIQSKETPADGFSTRGVFSISQVVPDFFEISVVRAAVIEGTKYRALVRATRPIGSRPLAGVNFAARIDYKDTDSAQPVSTASGVSDRDGNATLDFSVPVELNESRLRLEVKGSRAGLVRLVSTDLFANLTTRISLTTDKPLYQPGQTIHVRILAQKPDGSAAAQKKFVLRIEDPEDTMLHRAELTTSRFGVAATSWQIPANARLGEYRVGGEIEEEEDHPKFWWNWHKIRISRYDLPNFSVKARPDRPYYLPGQNAQVEIGADYLFGKPVTRGHVKLVRETFREWNYREQKWDIGEEEKVEGELDDRGRFVASLDLARYFPEDDNRKFEDINWTAYVTDATTGRTEQRRFDLRLTRESIHVYLIDDFPGSTGPNPDFYITCFYADGEPAQCNVDLVEKFFKDVPANPPRERVVAKVSTNRYGVAKASRVPLSRDFPDAELHLIARDGKGATGHETERRYGSSSSTLRIETAKTIHGPGQPIEVNIESDPPASWAFLSVARGWKLLRWHRVELRGGRGRIVLPYASDFTDDLTLTAFTQDGRDSLDEAWCAVLYPRDHELRFSVKTNREQYRPGEDALAEFAVRSPDGQPVESVVGVSITDKAVDERERTETESGLRAGLAHYDRFPNGDESLGGVTRGVLDKVDASRPVPSDLDLVAEFLLRDRGYWVDRSISGRFADPADLFHLPLLRQLAPVRRALDARYKRTGEYPTNPAKFLREMHEFGIAFDRMVDPWGEPYTPTFSIVRNNDVLQIKTAGPDKRKGTADDFTALRVEWPYFKSSGGAIDLAVAEYHRRTAGFIRDKASLSRELLLQGVSLDSLRDPWGQTYRLDFRVSRTRFRIEVLSGGPNRRFDGASGGELDDFPVWISEIDYTGRLRKEVDSALGGYFDSNLRLPNDEREFDQALSKGNVARDVLLDPWGRRCYSVFRTEKRYSDRIKFYKYAQGQHGKSELTPVTQQVSVVTIRSAGPDGKEGTSDDFDVHVVSLIIGETDREGVVTKPHFLVPPGPEGTGAIAGVVVDPYGTAISNAGVTVRGAGGALLAEARSGDDGRFLIHLPAGTYEVRVDSPGFKPHVIVDVPVTSSSVTEVSISLEVGVATETVSVVAEATQTKTKSARLSLDGASGASATQISTPRLREFFPETLVWSPEIETDQTGRAQLKFKLADNITTWKLSAIASTIGGEVGIVEKNILAFQPFFVEHAPPPVLTEGDRIALPVVVRNYLERPQSVQLEMAAAPWFRLSGAARQQLDVAAGESANKVFDFQAIGSTEAGAQRVTALAGEASDAIERRVTVHPDGQEIVSTASRIVGADGLLETIVPESVIAGSARSELKIYPNLMAHLTESVQAIMQRPYGCAEQTISAAWPSLLLLQQKSGVSEKLRQKALGYLSAACNSLLNYRNEDDGFSYWGRGESDPALTAYAIRFLQAASKFVAVDQEVTDEAREWLIKRQLADGRWVQTDWKGNEDPPRTALLTAYIARVLTGVDAGDTGGQVERKASTAIKHALGYLSRRVAEIDEPYLIASYALAAIGSGDKAGGQTAVARLRKLARKESTSSYWALETNTPFYGWGLAGRVETTALALQAIAANAASNSRSTSPAAASIDPGDEELIGRGLDFLLRKKDCYGVWYSTQATVNVLDALMTLLGRDEANGTASGPAQVLVNGVAAASVEMPPPGEAAAPISVNLTRFMKTGANRVEIRRPGGTARASAQLVTGHWEPWDKPGRDVSGPAKDGESATTSTPSSAASRAAPSRAMGASTDPASRSSRLRVHYDKTEAAIGEEIRVNVEAERMGFRGYGMMLAEIGLPPGADVDRASLDEAMTKSDWQLQQYDVLPDRLIVYLWPQAGGTRFDFRFRARFGLDAKTSASVLHDYYNPEARVVLAPARFRVK